VNPTSPFGCVPPDTPCVAIDRTTYIGTNMNRFDARFDLIGWSGKVRTVFLDETGDELVRSRTFGKSLLTSIPASEAASIEQIKEGREVESIGFALVTSLGFLLKGYDFREIEINFMLSDQMRVALTEVFEQLVQLAQIDRAHLPAFANPPSLT